MKEFFKKNIVNIRGSRISEKLIIIESDDWGAIRIPDRESQTLLVKDNLISLKDPFSAYDCLESYSDFEALFDVLRKHKDADDFPPVFTTNTVMANPDFKQISLDRFTRYSYEPFYETYNRYYPEQNTFEKYQSGIRNGYLYPQFHAREHLNVSQWLNRLMKRDERYLKAFDLKCFAIDDDDENNFRSNLMATYDYNTLEELSFIREGIHEGLRLFNNIFGFSSLTSIPPCYVWNQDIESILSKEGVQCIQSSKVQQMNLLDNNKYIRKWHYMGEHNSLNQNYTIRNVLFEPALNPSFDWVENTIESIAIAFFWGKPAIIGSHRINYVGGLSTENRDKNLKLLDGLLQRILEKWPDVKFINSARLRDIYSNG